jgi:hypothetical protein
MIALAVFLGLYFGMRNSPVPPAPDTVSSDAGLATTGQAPPSPALIARVQADAGRALEALRHEMATACPPPDGTRVAITSSVAFDKEGQNIAWGMTPRDAASASVVPCLRTHFHSLRIPPPGRLVSVAVPLVLP